jgi:DNA-binding response OmpR family regulator
MSQKKKKIIIAEDEPTLMGMYKLYFERADFEVIGVENGSECIDSAKKDVPDLILLDIMMPKVDGWEVLKNLKNDPEAKKIPILVFSNFGQPQEIQKGLDMGADDYVVKSNLTPKEVLDKVNQMILKNDEKNSAC